jgi:DNA mismatch repair protein Mlh1 C-terminus
LILQEELRDMIVQLLAMKAPQLRDLWAIDVQADGSRLAAVPALVGCYKPDADALPELLVSLAVDVDWEDEKRCLVDMATVRCACQRDRLAAVACSAMYTRWPHGL